MSKKRIGQRTEKVQSQAVAATGAGSGAAETALARRIRSVLQQVLFFGAFYYFVGWIVEPHLIFHGNGAVTNFPSFYKTWPFLWDHLSRPGGPADYLSAFLSQWFYYSHYGALVITAQAWGIFCCIRYILGAMRLSPLRWAGYVPAMAMALLYGRYTYYFATTTALLVALALTCVYLLVVRRWNVSSVRAASFVFLMIAGHYLAAGGVLLFAVLAVLYELLQARRWQLALAYLAIAAVTPYVLGVVVFGASIINAYSDSLPISWRILRVRSRLIEVAYGLYLFVPAMVGLGGLLAMLWHWHRNRAGVKAHHGKKEPAQRGQRLRALVERYRKALWLGWGLETVLVLAVGSTAAVIGFDRKCKANFAVDYYAFHRMWPEVLAESKEDLVSPSVIHAVNRALYHTGRLGDEMFRWPQDPSNLFLRQTKRRQTFWQSLELYYDLGYINMAEHLLTECLEGLGDRPMILQRLALVNMVKGNIGTARVYLGALERTLFHGQWARDYLALLDRDPELTTDAAIQQARSIALKKDIGYVSLPEETMLGWLLEQGTSNRMAYEYLLSWYLMNKQLENFTQWIQRCAEFRYPRMPRHFEEASLVYVYATRKPFYLAGYAPSDEARRRIDDFSKTMQRHGGDKQAAFDELAKRHAGSYFFYHTYMNREKGR